MWETLVTGNRCEGSATVATSDEQRKTVGMRVPVQPQWEPCRAHKQQLGKWCRCRCEAVTDLSYVPPGNLSLDEENASGTHRKFKKNATWDIQDKSEAFSN